MPSVGGEAFSVKNLLGICSCLLSNGSSASLLILVSCNVLQVLHTNLQKIFILVLVLNEFVENTVHNGFMKQGSLHNAFQPRVI
jgi:hypothetical protein